MENNNTIQLIRLFWKYKFIIVSVTILSIAASIVFSSPWFIEPKYKSETIIYPSNLIPYSSETPTEQMLQLFRSDEIREGVIKKHQLIQHYIIDTNKLHYQTNLIREFEDNVSVKKTRYESVEVEVYDKDPDMARDIIFSMIDLFNLKVRKLQREKTREVLNIWEGRLKQKRTELDSLKSFMNTIREKSNILKYDLQVKEATRGYVSGNSRKASELLDQLELYGGEVQVLEDHLEKTMEDYNSIKLDYEKTLSDLTKELTYTNIVTNPVSSDMKSYPIRWLIVFCSFFASVFFTFIVVIFVEKYRNFKGTII